jgi:hypothetical protein
VLARAAWITLLAVGALAVLAFAGGLRFQRRVGREVELLWANTPEPRAIDRARLEALPAPVRAYLARAIGTRQRAVRTVRIRHRGSFRPRLEGGWLAIRGRQYFAADPPGFVWWGRVRLAPGLWIDARDRCVDGAGGMRVSAESILTLADAAGPEIDQGALLRLLGEMAWFPTALLDARFVQWEALDLRRCRAALRAGGRQVSATFEFGEDGLPATVSADRFRDLGGGRSALTPWSGRLADFREVDGQLVPHELTACWHVDGAPVPYARFQVERLEYDAAAPF